MSDTFKVLALGGDHIGPGVTDAALRVLRHVSDRFNMPVDIDEDLLGGASWDVHGTFCTDAVLEKARNADATLVGSVGGPEWDGIRIDGPITETDGLTRLRVELDIYNALRPCRAWRPLLDRTPFRADVVDGADLLIIREYSERAWAIPEKYFKNRYYVSVHGVGMTGEYPYLYHRADYASSGYDGIVEPGMVLCVESYIGKDGGREGVKLEQQVMVTETGTELLTDFPFEDDLLRSD